MSDRDWAVAAFNAVRSQAAGSVDARQNFRTLCMNAPALLRQAGAMQAIAFWRRTGNGQAFSDEIAKAEGGTDGDALLQRLASADDSVYVTASRKLVRIAGWFRRFAQSELST